MASNPPPPGETPLPCDLAAEQDLIGAVLFDEEAFERAALKPSEFYYLRFRYIWEACQKIRKDGNHIDASSVQKYLEKAGRWQEVTKQFGLDYYFNPNLLNVEADAHSVREMAERRKMITQAAEATRVAYDLTMPLPGDANLFQNRWTMQELSEAEFPEPDGPVPGLIANGLTVLGGRPKRGKSWLMLAAGCALATGGMFLGKQL